MEDPHQPLIQFEAPLGQQTHSSHPMRGLQLNINKLNTILPSDENALQPLQQQQQSNYLPLKPAALQQHTQQLTTKPPAVIDENTFGLQPLKPSAFQAHQKGLDFNALKPLGGGRDSPKEPSPPKFKLYSRNSLRQNLPPVNRENVLPVASLKEQPLKQQDSSSHQPQQPQKENPPQPQPQQLPQPPLLQRQESIISRIPRLSLKFPLNLINANTHNQQQRDVKPSSSSGRLAPLAELRDENGGGVTTRKMEIEPIVCEKAQELEEIEDIDKSTSRDAIFLVCDIAKDIYDYMYELEEAQAIKHDYLKEQKIFTPKVRQRLINWCIEIHSQLKLLPETLYLTIAVIDRFFDKVQVKQQSQVQLVAVGATLIASKYEEIYPPDVGDLMHLSQNNYTRREIMRVEIQILEQLNFDLGKPIPLVFLRRFSKAAHCDQKMHAIAKYLMELSLSEYECSHWRPSLLAATALFITIHLTRQTSSPSAIFGSLTRRPAAPPKDCWTRSLIHYTRYSRKQLHEPAAVICKVLKRTQKSPQSYACVKKNLQNLGKWPELKSAKVDELIKLGDHQQI